MLTSGPREDVVSDLLHPVLLWHGGRHEDENGWKRTENRSIVFVFIFLDENGNGSRTTGSENGCGINGNTKTGKYDRKIDRNER
jgi:hypothetical protein